MVEASAHSMPSPAFLAFAVLGAMSQNPAPGFSEMVSPDDGPPTGPAAEAAGMAIQKGTASRRSLKREADEEAKQAKRPKVEGEGGAPGGAPLPPPDQQQTASAHGRESSSIAKPHHQRVQVETEVFSTKRACPSSCGHGQGP